MQETAQLEQSTHTMKRKKMQKHQDMEHKIKGLGKIPLKDLIAVV